MKFTLKVAKPHKLAVDSLNLFLFEEDLAKSFSDFPPKIIAHIKEALNKENFKGAPSDQLVMSGSLDEAAFYKMSVSGLGKKAEFDLAALYESVGRSIRLSEGTKAVKIAFDLPLFWLDKFGPLKTVETVVIAAMLSSYKFLKYKSQAEINKIRPIEEIILVIPAQKLAQAEEGIRGGILIAGATLYARDLVNEPAQMTTPSFLAEEAVKIAKNSKGAVTVKIWEEEEIKKNKMEAFLGVSRGSHQPPRFIIMRYKPARPKKKIALLGKGITFDTGGLSLKGSEHMETMKLDMAGAAAVLGIFSVIGEIKPPIEVVGLIAACENMPGGRALKPGDILKAANGKTIEVLNTDAEGRLTLADTLSFAVKSEKPDEMIDLATLTGACMVALGENIAGLFGNDEKLLAALKKASNSSGDRVWQLPLEKSYTELIKSQIADIKNTQTGKYGGAITAALFLNEFTADVPWAHLDIAGPAFAEKVTPLTAVGGTGFGVRLLLNYLISV